MPRIPEQPKNLNQLDSADIINKVRDDIGGQYADMVPIAVKPGDTMENGTPASYKDSLGTLRAIGDVLQNYHPMANQFLSALVNRVGMVYITSRLYRNPLERFKKGMLEYGETIEEIFVGMAEPFQFNPNTERSPFKTADTDIKAVFHYLNYQVVYEATVSNDMLRQAFLSWQGITDLIAKIIEQVYTAANYDEYLTFKYMIAKAALEGWVAFKTIPELDEVNATQVTKDMINAAKDMQFVTKDYTEAGNENYTDPSYLSILITIDTTTTLDVDVLAMAFNMDKATLIGRQVQIDSFTRWDYNRMAKLYKNFRPFTQAELKLLSSIKALMVDNDWFMVFDNYVNMTEIYNPLTLKWNYFYHRWNTFSHSPFVNGLLFTTQENTVTGVTINAPVTTAVKGGQVQMTAKVSGTGFVNQSVNWSIGNNTDSNISNYGVLTIGKNETASTIVVTATSVQNQAITNTYSITISGN